MINIRRLITRRSGQTMVEFALLAPIFFLLVMGVFDLGRAGFYFVTVSDLARSAAREAVTYDTGQPLLDSQIVSDIGKPARSMAITSFIQPAACGTTTPPNPLTSCYQPPIGSAYIFIDRSGLTAFPKYLKVSIVYHFEPTTPMIRAIFQTYYVVGSSTMETEF